MVDLFYFDKSTKRKSELLDYCTFCDTGYRKVLKHIHTQWLSLELAIDRSLRVCPGLKSYLNSKGIKILAWLINFIIKLIIQKMKPCDLIDY